MCTCARALVCAPGIETCPDIHNANRCRHAAVNSETGFRWCNRQLAPKPADLVIELARERRPCTDTFFHEVSWIEALGGAWWNAVGRRAARGPVNSRCGAKKWDQSILVSSLDCFLMIAAFVVLQFLWPFRDKELAGENIADYAFIIWYKHPQRLLFSPPQVIKSFGNVWIGHSWGTVTNFPVWFPCLWITLIP